MQVELRGLPTAVPEGSLVQGELQLSSRGGAVSGIRLLAAQPDLLLANDNAPAGFQGQATPSPLSGSNLDLAPSDLAWSSHQCTLLHHARAHPCCRRLICLLLLQGMPILDGRS